MQKIFQLALSILFSLSLTITAAESPIVKNGTFEKTDDEKKDKPAYWDLPDGLGVKWLDSAEAGDDKVKSGKAICMNTKISEIGMVTQWKKKGLDKIWDIPGAKKNPIAATYGLSLYSAYFSVKEGQPYRITFDYLGKNGGGKVWCRGYGVIKKRRRRLYENVVKCYSDKPKEWITISKVFKPRLVKPSKKRKITEMRVMLYAFWPASEYWFDNIKIEPVTHEVYDAVIAEEKAALERHRQRGLKKKQKNG